MMPTALAAATSQDLLRWGILFFLIVLPVLKGLLEQKKRAAEEARGGPRPPRPAPLDEFDDPWKRLLRGETVARPPPARPIAPAPSPARSPEQSRSPEHPRSLEHARSPEHARSFDDARSLEQAPSAEELEAESFATPFVDADLFESEPIQELESDLSSLGETSILGERSTLEGAGLASALNAPRGALGSLVQQGDQAPFAAIDIAASDWSRAVILSEILAPPLALRGDGGVPIAHARR